MGLYNYRSHTRNPHELSDSKCTFVFYMHFSVMPTSVSTYPEWPHSQCIGLHCAIREAQGVLPMRVGGATCNWTILSPISDAIVHGWLWSTATRSCSRPTYWKGASSRKYKKTLHRVSLSALNFTVKLRAERH